MIIECPACSKKFNIDEKLIPDLGRLLKCGNCDHTWFFKKEQNIKLEAENNKLNETEENKLEINIEPAEEPLKKTKKIFQYIYLPLIKLNLENQYVLETLCFTEW